MIGNRTVPCLQGAEDDLLLVWLQLRKGGHQHGTAVEDARLREEGRVLNRLGCVYMYIYIYMQSLYTYT